MVCRRFNCKNISRLEEIIPKILPFILLIILPRKHYGKECMHWLLFAPTGVFVFTLQFLVSTEVSGHLRVSNSSGLELVEWLQASSSSALSSTSCSPLSPVSSQAAILFYACGNMIIPREITDYFWNTLHSFILWAAYYFCLIPSILSASQDWPLSCLTLCECMEVNGEALELHAKETFFPLLLQVAWESVSGTASHAVKSKLCMIKSLLQ